MSTVLDTICTKKKAHIERKKTETPIEKLKNSLKKTKYKSLFLNTLKSNFKKNGSALIAEVKKASPSKGIIRDDFDVAEIADIYTKNGAACLSVLTDEPYFQGHDENIARARAVTDSPILRKDFMVDPYQIYESRALGTDCILLIMAALSDELAQELYELSLSLGMDVLIEVHDKTELDRALALSPLPAMIGVNNRNLKTLDVDLETGRNLAAHIPDSIFKIAESGISSRHDILEFQKAGYQGFLIGEHFMRQPDISVAMTALFGKNQNGI